MATSVRPSGEVPTPNTRQRRGPRHRVASLTPQDDPESLRELREHTAGLGDRFDMASFEGMRQGVVKGPQFWIRRYLLTAKGLGLPKSWAVRLALWVSRQVDAIWPMEATPLEALEQRAMALESQDDAAEKCHDLKQDVESLRHRLATQMAELAADSLVAAKLQRRLEDVESCK